LPAVVTGLAFEEIPASLPCLDFIGAPRDSPTHTSPQPQKDMGEIGASVLAVSGPTALESLLLVLAAPASQ